MFFLYQDKTGSCKEDLIDRRNYEMNKEIEEE